MKYPVGAKIICGDIKGIIIENFKLPEDTCVQWETGQKSSYDSWWLDQNVEVVQ